MVLQIFQDKALSGLLIGMGIYRLIEGKTHINRTIRRKIKGIEIDFLFLGDFGGNFETKGLIWKDIRYDKHLHFFLTTDQLGVGLVVTREPIPKGPGRNISVDNKDFFEMFGDKLKRYFENEREVLEITTTKFNGSRIIIYNPHLVRKEIKNQILKMDLDEGEREITIDELKVMDEAIGIILNEQGNATDFFAMKDQKIHCFDYEYLNEIGNELIVILNKNFPRPEI